MKIIGLDVGEKRIGVAKVDSETRIAVPVGFVLVDGSEWQEIGRIANLNNTNCFVLGLPRSNEGNETAQSLYVRNFARTLTEKIPEARIKFQDESLTSVEAEQRLKARKKKYEKGEIDAEAATIILQDFVEGVKNGFLEKNDATSESAASPSQESLGTLKKTADKAKLNAKKASSKLKKFTIFGIPVVVILVLAGITAGLKIRDQIRAEREEEYRRQEAEMTAEVFNFTIQPGETIFDVKKNLARVGYSKAEIEAGFSYDYSNEEGLEFLKDRPSGASLEGYLLGETYEFYAGEAVEKVLLAYLRGMAGAIEKHALEAKFAAQGLNLYEGITLASVVQREAPPAEQAAVARVFLNRLEAGMGLGSDVTVSYALDILDPKREIYSDNVAALTVDSCYNTRLYGGLPCGPIANPGISALLAVAEPGDNSYLYFLTGDDGLMYYSSTGSGHEQNTDLYCKELCNVAL